MGNKYVSGCFILHIFMSLVLHLAELALNGVLVYCLWSTNDDEHKMFSLVTGIIIIPLVLIQLLSAILMLNRNSDKMTTCQCVAMAILHLLQMGFTWRHISVMTQKNVITKKTDMAELFLLRMTYGFAAGFPLMLVQVYLILTGVPLMWNWVLYAAAAASLLSTSWALASFQRQHETCDAEDIVLPWPGMIFRLLWRTGEIISRVLSLVLFASLYKEWLFLVISLHWLTMLVCVCTSVFSAITESVSSMTYKISFRVLVAYMYVFTFINFSNVNPTFRYVMFYIIMFLENGTLNIVWFLKSSSQDTESSYLVVFISAASFFVAIVSVTVYYKCFHISISNIPKEGKSLVCVQKSCINCKLSLCVKHKLKMQRPFSAGWITQYNSAVYNGQYYKNILHDSLLDDTVDSEHCKMSVKDNASEINNSDVEKQSVVDFQSAGTYVHRRFINTNDDEIMSYVGMDTSFEFKDLKQPEVSISDGSSIGSGPPWLPCKSKKSASQTCLLTDNWDNLSELEVDDANKRRSLASCRSLLRGNSHNWYSDGYSTDCTVLDWSKLPVTSIGKQQSVVSDSESDYYCHCNVILPHNVRNVNLPNSVKMKRPNRIVSKKSKRLDSLTDSVKEKYVHWSRKRPSCEIQKNVTNIAISSKSVTDSDFEHSVKPDDSSVNNCEIWTTSAQNVTPHTTDLKQENPQVIDTADNNKTTTKQLESSQLQNKQQTDNYVADNFSRWLKFQDGVILFPKMSVITPVIGSHHSSFKRVAKSEMTPKCGKAVNGENYFRQSGCGDVVYENTVFVEDDGVFLDDPLPVTKETPWYVCSESEDSAFPQETFSSSNCELSNSESDDSLELII